MRELPFKGYSWQISQHEKAFSEKITFDLLACAQQFEGASGYSDELNSLLVHEGLLTDNVRDGKASPWRDYQQVLPEIGLIHSTKVARSIRLTPLGYSFLSGNLNYEEILTLQLFKYQYPNGQKFQLGPKIQAAWPSNENVPGSFYEASGVAMSNLQTSRT